MCMWRHPQLWKSHCWEKRTHCLTVTEPRCQTFYSHKLIPWEKKRFKTFYSFSHVTNCHARVTAVLIRPGWLSAVPWQLLVATREKKGIWKGLKCKTTLSLASYIIIHREETRLSSVGSARILKFWSLLGEGEKKRQTQRRNRWKPVDVFVFSTGILLRWAFDMSGLALPWLQPRCFPPWEG